MMITVRRIINAVMNQWILSLHKAPPNVASQVKVVISFLENVAISSWDSIFPADVVPIPAEDLKVVLKFLPNTPETESTINLIKRLLAEGDPSEVN